MNTAFDLEVKKEVWFIYSFNFLNKWHKIGNNGTQKVSLQKPKCLLIPLYEIIIKLFSNYYLLQIQYK